jgi:dolichyl-phosphate-mannose--protein O-mannosyl transferase
MPSDAQQRPFRLDLALAAAFVLLLSYFTYFHNYASPQAVFWDENYHIASAQKYLHGVYFMEQHPPLGKLLIALGEVMFHPNTRTDQFLGTDYGQDFGSDFSFVGYRFFSALFGWLSALILFFIFYLITRHTLFATLLSFLYIFDNAIIVHLRGAMLEGPLVFFSCLTILAFLLLLEAKTTRRFALFSLAFGAAFALTLTTKVVGLIFILLIPFILWKLFPAWRRIGMFLTLSGIAFLAVYISVWQIHFSLGKRIQSSLPDRGYYQASEPYKKILREGKQNDPRAFPIMLFDSLKFVGHYNSGAPRLDLCKIDENGSPFYFWPLGARAINYRWETPNGRSYRYLYLQANPVAWALGLLGVFLTVTLLTASVLFPPREPPQRRFLLVVFFTLYACYMIAVSQITRVMYLYHYFLPLLFSFILFGIVFLEIRAIGRWRLTESNRTYILLGLATFIFFSYQFYRPLTYYEPLTKQEFEKRAIVPLWELSCVGCNRESGLVIPTK